MIQALTPGDLNAITNVVSVACIMIGVPLIVCGAAGIAEWWRGRKSVTAHVHSALPPGRCDWCDGFTTDRRTCNCTEACTFVPRCGAREGLDQ